MHGETLTLLHSFIRTIFFDTVMPYHTGLQVSMKCSDVE